MTLSTVKDRKGDALAHFIHKIKSENLGLCDISGKYSAFSLFLQIVHAQVLAASHIVVLLSSYSVFYFMRGNTTHHIFIKPLLIKFTTWCNVTDLKTYIDMFIHELYT